MFHPIGNRVLVELVAESNQTESGLLLPEATPNGPTQQYGYVLAIGDKVEAPIKEGDKVAWIPGSAYEVLVGDTFQAIIRVDNIVATISKEG